MKAFRETLSKAQRKFFDKVYGNNQLHLRILGTHPDYQRRGAATKHCQWGMELAKRKSAAVTLFSSPLGQKLYSSLSFKMIGTVIVQVEREEEKLTIGAMVYETGSNSWWRCMLM